MPREGKNFHSILHERKVTFYNVSLFITPLPPIKWVEWWLSHPCHWENATKDAMVSLTLSPLLQRNIPRLFAPWTVRSHGMEGGTGSGEGRCRRLPVACSVTGREVHLGRCGKKECSVWAGFHPGTPLQLYLTFPSLPPGNAFSLATILRSLSERGGSRLKSLNCKKYTNAD